MSIASDAFEFCGTFEAELLVKLMLQQWNHPFAADGEYFNNLLERAAERAQAAMDGQSVYEGLPADQSNFVACLWNAESNGITADSPHMRGEVIDARIEWLEQVRRSLPSCFCSQDRLL